MIHVFRNVRPPMGLSVVAVSMSIVLWLGCATPGKYHHSEISREPEPVVVAVAWYNHPSHLNRDPAMLAIYSDGSLICRSACGPQSVFSRFRSVVLPTTELDDVLRYLNGPEVVVAAGKLGTDLSPDFGITKLGWSGGTGWRFTGLYGADAYEGGPDCGTPLPGEKVLKPPAGSVPMVNAVRFLDGLCMRAVTEWIPRSFVTHFSPASKGRGPTVREIEWPRTLPHPEGKGCRPEDLTMDGRFLPEMENLIAVLESHRADYVLRMNDCRFLIHLKVELPGEARWLSGSMLPF